jgi:hypothetical protein
MEVKKIIKDRRFVDFEEFYRLKAQNDSLFDSLMPGDIVELACTSYSMGCDPSVDVALSTVLWELDDDRNLIDSYNEWYERASHRPGDLENNDWIIHCRCSDEPGSIPFRTYYPDEKKQTFLDLIGE